MKNRRYVRQSGNDTWGRALKFYSSCRVDVRRIGTLKDGEDVVGQRVRVKVVKNKVAPPFRVAEFDMMHADGISVEGDVLDLAVACKLIDKTGTWLRYGDVHLGQGEKKPVCFLRQIANSSKNFAKNPQF